MEYKKSALLFSCILGIMCLPGLQSGLLQSKEESLHADYVVVGVGTAGAVMAKKLSDDKKTSVIALHAGSNFTQTPLIKYSANSVLTVPAVLTGPPFAETGFGVPQPHADGREILWALPLPLGGASSINAGAYCRGTNQLYAKWEKIAGKKWSVERILDLYKKLEHYHGKTTNHDARGYHGPIDVRLVPRPSKVAKVFTKAIIRATGFPFVLDYNDPKKPIGVSSQLQYTQSGHGGKFRVSSATAFLNEDVMTASGHGVHGRKLRVLFKSHGLKTIWKGKRAIGVQFMQHGKIKKVFADKGVIVCAGLRSSPFLMHSGIGPKDTLEAFHIPVKYNNSNVGKGLADQPSLRMIFDSNPEDISLDPNGLFTQIAWLPEPHSHNKKSRQLRIATITKTPGTTLFLLDLCQPKSRGSVSISSSDPLSPPVVNLGLLTNSSDLVTLQKGLQVYVKKINKVIHHMDPAYKLVFPDPAILNDTSAVDAFIRAVIESNQHFQSHCRMAAKRHGGVVNSRGRVYGVKGLYVADDSVVPLCMDGSPMASAYLIAENIAEMLLEHIN